MSAALPRHLHRRGHDVRVFLPLYGRIDTDAYRFARVPELDGLEIRLGRHLFQVSVFAAPLPGSDLPIYFVHCPPLYGRSAIYTSDPDEHLRFLVLSRAAFECSQRWGFAPDILHCNDWQSGLVPVTLKTRYAWDALFKRTKTLLTIHNLNYQGVFGGQILPDTGLADSAHLFHQDQLREGRINFLLTGILYADGVNTVSPTYAREIQTPEHGAGLDGFLRARTSTVVGILNGIDDEEWSPEKDRLIPFRYTADDLAPKEANKQALLSRMRLSYAPGVPTLGIVSRLAGQKGLDLLMGPLPRLLMSQDVRLAILGSGERRIENFFHALARQFPRKVGFHQGFSNPLAHLIEAGSDMFLMPSRYEPCGLNQMYSLKYGTVPLVHRTGGLADTVEQWNPRTGEGTGFSFEHADEAGVTWALSAALETYRDPARWRRLVQNGMARNTTWDVQGRIYEELYGRLAGG